MVKTKVIGSIAAVMLLCMGLYGGLITPAQAQDIAQINQAIEMGERAGKLCGIPITAIYCVTLIMPLYDVMMSIMRAATGIEYTLTCPPLTNIIELIIEMGEKVIPESIAEIWNLAVVFLYKTIEGSMWLFEMIPLPFIGLMYKTFIGGCVQSNLLELIL